MSTAVLSRRTSRDGSIQLVVIALLLLLTLAGILVLSLARERILVRRASDAADALALAALYELYPAEYEVDSGRVSRTAQAWRRLERLAAANGVRPGFFQPISRDDVRVGTDWVEVTIRPRASRIPAVTARAVGVPAGRIAAGRVMPDAGSGMQVTTGCLPIGVQLDAVPVDGNGMTRFWVQLGTNDNAAAVLRLPGSSEDPVEQVRYLAGPGGQGVSGSPPPDVFAGRPAAPADVAPELLETLDAGLAGRVAIVPLMHDDVVMGFGRMRILAVDVVGGRVEFELAPTAVSRLAGGGHPVLDDEETVSTGTISTHGLVLHARLKG